MRKKNKRIEWVNAFDVKKRSVLLVKGSGINWLKLKKIYFIRSYNSKSNAYARIWGLPRLWQIVLNLKPAYIIEVISEKYDKLPDRQKDKILYHELAHIPRTFSGSLVPHFKKGKRKFSNIVNKLAKACSNNCI